MNRKRSQSSKFKKTTGLDPKKEVHLKEEPKVEEVNIDEEPKVEDE